MLLVQLLRGDCLSDCQDKLTKCVGDCMDAMKMPFTLQAQGKYTNTPREKCHETCMQVEHRGCQRQCIELYGQNLG